MKQKSLAKNAVWNFLYSGVSMIFPLITSPYVSRILGASNLGKVDFARSIVQWFIVFSIFGINTYGVREIARVREDKEKMSKVFSALFTISIIFSFLATLIYFVFIFNSTQVSDELPLFIMMSLSVILNVFNIDWLYQGIEEYSYITIRNAIIKLFSLIAIFIFVTSQGDYIIYGFISVLGTTLGGVLNLINSRKYVKYSLKGINIYPHLKYLGTFFSITFITTLYTNVDRTLLGFLDTSESVAFMSRSKTMTNLAVTFSSSIAAVAMPRASYYLKKDRSKFNHLLTEVPKFILLFTIPTTIGIIILAPDIMYILGGIEFMPAASLLRIISIITVLSSLATFIHSQVLVPSGNEKLGLFASIIASLVSLLANFILIPLFSYIGAGIALIFAEFTAVAVRYLLAKKIGYRSISFFNTSTLKFCTASIIMIFPILLLQSFIDSILFSFFISIAVGAGVYFLVLILLKEETINYIFNKLLMRFKKLSLLKSGE